jgi:hypothetical protein
METEIKIRTGFGQIFESCFLQSTLRKGRKIVSHIFNVEEVKTANETVIRGRCVRQASISKETYKVEVNLDITRKIIGGYCSCIAGYN